MSVLDLARLQFAGTTAVHWIFVLLTLGLAPLVAVLHTVAVSTQDPQRAAVCRRATLFWGQLYVVNYVVGIVSGLVIEFQFGLSWSGLSKFAGNVFGAPLALETLIAFFAESTFLGLWLFGWGRLRPRVHVTLIWLVAFTAYASAYWILVANGFLQNPVGSQVRGGTSHLVDVAALLTNPSALLALGHISAAALLAGGLFLTGMSALRRLKSTVDDEDRAVCRLSARLGVTVAAVSGYVVYTFGGLQYPLLGATQPMKLAALEPGPALDGLAAALADRHGGVPEDYAVPQYAIFGQYLMLYLGYALFIFAIVAFLVLFRSALRRRRLLGAAVVLLAAAPVGEFANALAHYGEAAPGVGPYWYAGAVVLLGALLFAAPRLAAAAVPRRIASVAAVLVVPLPFAAAVGGWLFREGGRQPWLVYEQLLVADAVSPVPYGQLVFSLLVFCGVLLALLVVDLVLLVGLARRGPAASQLAGWAGPPAEPGSGDVAAEKSEVPAL